MWPANNMDIPILFNNPCHYLMGFEMHLRILTIVSFSHGLCYNLSLGKTATN